MIDKLEIEKWKEKFGINKLLMEKAIEREADPEKVRNRADDRIAALVSPQE